MARICFSKIGIFITADKFYIKIKRANKKHTQQILCMLLNKTK
jgi:hypothetical protein